MAGYHMTIARPSLHERVGRGIDRLERRAPLSVLTKNSEYKKLIQSIYLTPFLIGSDAAPQQAATSPNSTLLLTPDTDDISIAPEKHILFGDVSSPQSPVTGSPTVSATVTRSINPTTGDFPMYRNWVSRLTAAKAANFALPHGITVRQKSHVLFCVRRKSRRGVLLALGQGGGYHRKPRRNSTSDIWC